MVSQYNPTPPVSLLPSRNRPKLRIRLKQKVAVYPPTATKFLFLFFLAPCSPFCLVLFQKEKGNSPCALHFIDLLESLVVEGRHLPATLFFFLGGWRNAVRA